MQRCVLVGCLTVLLGASVAIAEQEPSEPLSPENAECVGCHADETPGIFNQWKKSRHFEMGVGCLDCHGASASEPDAFEHHDAIIATLVTPNDCGECHEKIAGEFARSRHATAADISESAEWHLALVRAGPPVAITGCERCHGVEVETDAAAPNKLSRKSWPNSGAGRINPDGSLGACSSCHARHLFDRANARRPEACGQCHLGPDHPQKEAYDTSKHGNAYYTHMNAMNLDAEEWVVGIDYWAAPTCATCHMSATRTQPITHEVGERLSWNLRLPVSARQDNWKRKRRNMRNTCRACHGETFTDNAYLQIDASIRLYDEKFGAPAQSIMTVIEERGLAKKSPQAVGAVERIYWDLWHRHGRAARHGAAKMSPDYTWSEGMYEVIQDFYFRLIPAARALNDAEVDAEIDRVLSDPMHKKLAESGQSGSDDLNRQAVEETYERLFLEQAKP